MDTLRFAPFKQDRGKPFRVLLAARLLWEKGIREYVEAATRLRARAGEVEFLLAGTPDPGTPSTVPEEAIARWRETRIIKVLGQVDDMVPLLRAVDLAVLSSHREGAPKGLIEAAMELLIVATDHPDVGRWWTMGSTDFWFPSGMRQH